MDPTREDVPKISVDTIHDWNRIKETFSGTAFTLLDQNIASGGDTRLKNEILPHLNQFIERTFQISRPNLRVNGRNFDDFGEDDQEFEAFDEGLDRRIWSLSEQCLQWDVDIAKKRRERPQEVEKLLRDILQDNWEDSKFDSAALEKDLVYGDSLPPHVDHIAREAFALADELHQTIPLQSQRFTSLEEVESEVQSLKS